MNFIEGAPASELRRRPIGVRPEHLAIARDDGRPGRAAVGVAEHLGSDTFLHVHVDGVGLMTVRDRRRDRRSAMATRSG